MSGKQKIFWFDVETTGLDPLQNDILTLSGLIEIDGKIVDKINLKMQPINYKSITEEALRINGMKLEEIKKFESPHNAKKKLVTFFNKYVNRFDKTDKFIPAGYNVSFDVEFLFKLFQKCGDPYCGSYIDYHKLDVASLVIFFKIHGLFDFQGFKLADASKQLNIQLDAHDAKEDILATRQVYYKLMDKIEIKK
jgi:DNA polymerase-3 subunit epsilon